MMSKPKSIVGKSADKISKHYSENPLSAILLTALSIAVPQVAIGKEAIDRAVTKIQKERFQALLGELAKGEKLLTSEIVESEEFIHSFVVVYRAAINTYQREKIRRFARILLTAIEEDELARDKFEECVKTLETITERELWILSELQQLEKTWVLNSSEVWSKSTFIATNGNTDWVITTTMHVWEDFVRRVTYCFKLEMPVLLNILKRLEGLGLYSGTATRHINKGIHEIGTPTYLFEQFSEWIKLESEKDDSLHPDQEP